MREGQEHESPFQACPVFLPGMWFLGTGHGVYPFANPLH